LYTTGGGGHNLEFSDLLYKPNKRHKREEEEEETRKRKKKEENEH